MDPDQEQEQFRALFSELKRADERAAPNFASQWRAARTRPYDSSFARIRLAAGVLLAVAGVGVALLAGHFHHGQSIVRDLPRVDSPHTPHVAPDTVTAIALSQSISDWQSPTDFLLDLSDEESPASGSTIVPTENPPRGGKDHRHL